MCIRENLLPRPQVAVVFPQVHLLPDDDDRERDVDELFGSARASAQDHTARALFSEDCIPSLRRFPALYNVAWP